MRIIVFLLAGYGTGFLINRVAATFFRTAPVEQASTPAYLEPLIEAGWALGLALFLSLTPLDWRGQLGAVAALAVLSLIALLDLRYRRIPNSVVYPAIIGAGLLHLVWHPIPLASILLGAGLAFFIFFLTMLLRPGDLGAGDVKLAILVGMLLGFPHVLWALFVGGMVGALVAVYYLVARQATHKMQIAYGPFLCLGAAVALCFNPFPALV